MKKFDELNESEQEKALTYALQGLAIQVIDGMIDFDSDTPKGRHMNGVIEALRTTYPDEIDNRILASKLLDVLGSDLIPYAMVAAEETIYAEDHENFVYVSRLN